MALLFSNSLLNFLSFLILLYVPLVHSLSTVSISESSNQTLICAITTNGSSPSSRLNCTTFPSGIQIPFYDSIPNSSFSEIVSGDGFLCGLTRRSSNSQSILTCWRFLSINSTDFQYRRIYNDSDLKELDSGNSHVCGIVKGTNRLQCWQWHRFNSSVSQNFSKISVGENFVCGILENTRNVYCLGSNSGVVGREPSGSYREIAAGFNHACAIFINRSLVCWGDVKENHPQGKFLALALGQNRSCALRLDETVVCWGQNNFVLPQSLQQTKFVAIEAKGNVFCGVVTENLSLHCWGNKELESNSLVFDRVLPGPCRSECPGNSSIMPGSGIYCGQGLHVCTASAEEEGDSLSPSPEVKKCRSSGWSKKMVAFLVVGCVGSLALVLVCCFFLYRLFKVKCRVHDSGRLEEARTDAEAEHGSSRRQSGSGENHHHHHHQSGPVLEKRLSHLISLGNNGTNLEEFSLQVLEDATNNFSEDRKIGTGSFGSVYHGKLEDGREVAIKRAEATAPSSSIGGRDTKREEDKDSAFLRELEFLSRLNHKNLVRLFGFHEDNKERILVYEYLNNGSLHDHLHKPQENLPPLTWSARIKVALDAARGIQYLHDYAVPPIIHRDIKSSNILLDATWTAKVSDFGLSLMGPEDEVSHLSLRAAGTMGYIDPEYFRLQKLTTKSDVYSFGVLLLELLSGLKAIHKNENGVPRNVVDYMVPNIVNDDIHRVLDPNVPPPTPYEIEGVIYVGYLAADCVSLAGRGRPSMTEVVSNLERAFDACLERPTFSRSTTESST